MGVLKYKDPVTGEIKKIKTTYIEKVHVGADEPTDPNCMVWIKEVDEADDEYMPSKGEVETMIAEGTSADSNMLGGKNANSYIQSNPNLLINGDCRVNQRGASGYTVTTNGAYVCDMWKTAIGDDDNVVVTWNADNSVTIDMTNSTHNGEIYQKVETFTNDEMIMSVEINGIRYSVGGTNGTFSKYINQDGVTVAWIGCSVSDNLLTYRLYAYSGCVVTFKNAKLELGSVATPLSPRPYGEELALCQRYLVNLNSDKNNYACFGKVVGIRSGSNTVYAFCDLPVSLRSAKSLTLSYGGTIGFSTLTFGADTLVESLSLNIANNSTNQIMIQATVSDTTNVQVGGVLRAYNDANAYILISAEL